MPDLSFRRRGAGRRAVTERERCARELEDMAEELAERDSLARPGKRWPLMETCAAVGLLVGAAGRLRTQARDA